MSHIKKQEPLVLANNKKKSHSLLSKHCVNNILIFQAKTHNILTN